MDQRMVHVSIATCRVCGLHAGQSVLFYALHIKLMPAVWCREESQAGF